MLFWRNVGLKGGPASVAIYDREVLLGKVLDGEINPGPGLHRRFRSRPCAGRL